MNKALFTLSAALLGTVLLPAQAEEKNLPPASPATTAHPVPAKGEYAVLMSKACAGDKNWKDMGDALASRYQGKVILWDKSPRDAQAELKKLFPRYLAVIVKPEEAARTLVNDLFRMTRQFNDDPYGDCIWGLITGRTAIEAAKVVEADDSPLVIKRALGTTGFDHNRFDRSFMITDWGPNESWEQKNHGETDGKKTHPETPEGMAFLFTEKWKEIDPQLIVTSSHATPYNLEMPFSKGLIASMDGRFHILRADQLRGFAQFLRGAMFDGSEKDLQNFIRTSNAPLLPISNTPKVWVAAGNCLFGNANCSPNTMVVTALGAAGCKQVVGYTVPSWYGKGGWGTLSSFFDNTTTTTLSEAWFLNNQSILEETQRRFPKLMTLQFDEAELSPKDKEGKERMNQFFQKLSSTGYGTEEDNTPLGLVHDRDTVALYGDPAKVVVLDAKAPSRAPWTCPPDWTINGSTATLEITANKDHKGTFSFWFPHRLPAEWGTPVLVAGDKETPVKNTGVATENFVLIRDLDLKAGQKAQIIWKKK